MNNKTQETEWDAMGDIVEVLGLMAAAAIAGFVLAVLVALLALWFLT